ncbi:seven-hairpin glycosidase [Teratosphaeria nubilosa]|uniref:alpha-1,2-Mannosidase n=1 Tax=Teratosphaeria nubilosa TaxID=161662 RepID=A0A6G1L1L8_9PEZI|nr:seven-hairpin glycosidase [Teratosphaeria nubilosa]
MLPTILLTLLSTLSPTLALTPPSNTPHSYLRQKGADYDYTSFPTNQTLRATTIIQQFRLAWHGYKTYAFPNDELRPKNNTFANNRNGWGLTAIDALDTAVIMRQQDIVDEILDFVPTIDFTRNHSPTVVSTSLFETNIRYLGGLMGAYDLLQGPFADMVGNRTRHVAALLSQAKSLADTLKFAFDTPTGIPVNDLFLDNQTFTPDDQLDDGTYVAGLAQLGTLCLEWQHLSDLTGEPEYGDLVQKAESWWFRGREVWPGLTGGLFSVQNGSILDDYGGWTSGNDSAYEYLVKMFVYDPVRYGNYSDRWVEAVESSIAHLVSHPGSRRDLSMVGTFAGTAVQNYSQGLACFIGGNWILGSFVLGKAEYLDYGLAFAEFCADGYRYPAAGIGPQLYSWDETLLRSANLSNQTAFYERAGWFVPDPLVLGGGLAPEAAESWYYAYQATGEQYWRDVSWAYVLAQERVLRVGSGFAGITDIFQADGGAKGNLMASYFLAEVLKYQFLIQAPPEMKGEWDVLAGEGMENAFVYNTEAHPFRVVGGRKGGKEYVGGGGEVEGKQG